MAERKQAMNLTVPEPLAEAFYEVCRTYGHGKQKGMILSAAILMFLEADPATQGAYLKAVTSAEIDAGVRRMVAQTSMARPRPKIAAKKAGKAVHALYADAAKGRGRKGS